MLRFRRTSFTGRKASAPYMSKRAAHSHRFCMAATRKVDCGRAPKASTISPGLAWPARMWSKLVVDAERIGILKRQLIERLKEIKPDCVINSPEAEAECLPNTLNITFPGVENAGLMGMLDYRGIAVSAGSACSTGEDKPSHVLKAIGLSDQAARETIRISLGHRTSARDIRYVAQVIQDYVEGRTPFVNMITPAQLNETILFDEQTYILDVRPDDDRRKFKGLPNSHEVSPLSIEKYVDQLPRDKEILVVLSGRWAFAYDLVLFEGQGL